MPHSRGRIGVSSALVWRRDKARSGALHSQEILNEEMQPYLEFVKRCNDYESRCMQTS